ncbi:MAG: response regulator [Candidatus Hydrogenedentes bacterium]|nr:response regulator [Candidatus Hydrogenedentota bacterium]
MAKILIVDDEADIRRVFRAILARAGHEVRDAANGKAGLETFREWPADLIITDVFMPEKDGLEVVMDIRRISKEVKILAVSGGGPFAPNDFLAMAQSLGANAILYKGVNAETFLTTVNDLLK